MTAPAGENGSNEDSRNADALLEKLRKRTGGPKGSGLTPALIDELLIKGHSVTEIGKMFNTSRQNVSQMRRRRTGFYQSPRERVLEQNFRGRFHTRSVRWDCAGLCGTTETSWRRAEKAWRKARSRVSVRCTAS